MVIPAGAMVKLVGAMVNPVGAMVKARIEPKSHGQSQNSGLFGSNSVNFSDFPEIGPNR